VGTVPTHGRAQRAAQLREQPARAIAQIAHPGGAGTAAAPRQTRQLVARPGRALATLLRIEQVHQQRTGAKEKTAQP